MNEKQWKIVIGVTVVWAGVQIAHVVIDLLDRGVQW